MTEPTDAATFRDAIATGNRAGTSRHLAALAVATLLSTAWQTSAGRVLNAQPPELSAPTVSGKLLGPDGSAAAGLEVRLIPAPSSYARRLRELGDTDAVQVVDRTRSDADGRFELRAQRIGPYRLEILAAAPDTTPPTVVAPVHTTLLPLAEPTVLAPIQLPEMHHLVVDARSEDGKPVEGALVVAQASRWSGRERQAQEPARFNPGQPWQRPQLPQQPEPIYPTFGRAVARTDVEGLARFSLPTADANVFVAAPGFEVRASMVEGRDLFELRPDAGVTLRVLDSSGTPVSRAVIRVAESIAVPLALTDEHGEATVGLNQGEAIPFQVETEDRSFGRTQPIELPGDDSARPHVVEVQVTPAVAFSGRVVDAGTGRPVEGAAVWLGGRPGDHGWSGPGGVFDLSTRPRIRELHLSAAAVDYRTRTLSIPVERLASRGAFSIALTPVARITGAVTDFTGNPVADARVLVDRVDPRNPGTSLGTTGTSYEWRSSYGRDHQAISDVDGTFRLTGIDRGVAHRITVEAPGFVGTSADLPAVGQGGAPEPLQIVLSRGRRAWGTVVDEDGRPVPGASVDLMATNRNPRGGTSVSWDSLKSATTDTKGAFEFPSAAGGGYQLSVDHAEFVSPAPTSVDIPSGEGDTEIGTFALTPGTEIEGIVAGPDRRPVAGARVSAVQRGASQSPLGAGARNATTDDDGRFRIGGLTEQLAHVMVRADGYARFDLGSVKPATGEVLDIELNRGATLTGRVADSRGDAIPDTHLFLHREGGVIGAFNASYGPQRQERSQTDAQGRFRFDFLGPGPWRVQAYGAGGISGRAESDLIRLQTGETREIELVVEASGAEVVGTATNHLGDPVAGAEIRITSHGDATGQSVSRQGSSWQTQADPEGRFTYPSVPTGDATITASHPEYQNGAQEITIYPGSNEVSLTLEPGLEITGSVRSADGRPIPLALVQVELDLSSEQAQQWVNNPSTYRVRGGPHLPADVLTDANGDYRLTGLDAGVYRLQAWADGYGAGTPERTVRLDRGSAGGVDIVLPVEATVHVRVTGAPRGGVSVGAARDPGDFRPASQGPNGEYRIDGLGPGDWTVTAGDLHRRTVEETVTLAPGDETLVELHFEEGLQLTGLVTIAGQSVAGGSVTFQQQGGERQRWVDLDRQGRFEAGGLRPGIHVLMIGVGIPGAGNGVMYERTIELRGDQDLRFDLEPPAVLTGVVVNAQTRQPLAEAFVVTIVDTGPAEPLPGGMAMTGMDGTFELRSAPGAYDLSVRSEGFEDLTIPVELAAAEHRQGLVFELRPAAPGPPPNQR